VEQGDPAGGLKIEGEGIVAKVPPAATAQGESQVQVTVFGAQDPDITIGIPENSTNITIDQESIVRQGIWICCDANRYKISLLPTKKESITLETAIFVHDSSSLARTLSMKVDVLHVVQGRQQNSFARHQPTLWLRPLSTQKTRSL
jgi:hypothetical protein